MGPGKRREVEGVGGAAAGGRGHKVQKSSTPAGGVGPEGGRSRRPAAGAEGGGGGGEAMAGSAEGLEHLVDARVTFTWALQVRPGDNPGANGWFM